LIERGLVVERARLFVIDGSAGLRKAILHTFGQWAVIQRCQLHKMRNVIEHLPERNRDWARAKMRKAWESASADAARSILEGLARSLGDHPSATASVRVIERADRLVFANASDTSLNHITHTNGSWTSVKSIVIDSHFPAEAALAAVDKMLSTQ
jgi:transposase-like protein